MNLEFISTIFFYCTTRESTNRCWNIFFFRKLKDVINLHLRLKLLFFLSRPEMYSPIRTDSERNTYDENKQTTRA